MCIAIYCLHLLRNNYFTQILKLMIFKTEIKSGGKKTLWQTHKGTSAKQKPI